MQKNRNPQINKSSLMTGDAGEERQAQLSYGREKLSLKKHTDSGVVSDHPTRTRENNKSQQKKGQQKTGHEACLAKVVAERRKIEIEFCDGGIVAGELLEFDKYSIRIRRHNGECSWFFKSAMRGFKEMDR